MSAVKNNKNNGLSGIVEDFLEKYFAIYGEELPASGLYDRIMSEVEKPLLKMTLSVVDGNQVQAAKVLGINRNTLRKKMKDLGVSPR